MAAKYLNVMLTPAVRHVQNRTYGRTMTIREAPARDRLTEDEAAFIATRDSFYLATVSEASWPYVQHRGGRPGFLHIMDAQTLAFADYRGNQQLLSRGHLSVNDRVALFLMDYAQRTRLKILGHARVEAPEGYRTLVEDHSAEERPLIERIIVIDVVGFDWNCPRHITPRYTLAQVDTLMGPLRARIAELERQLAREMAR